MICSYCNQSRLLPIWYGVPGSKEVNLAQLDQLVLGGPVEKEYTHYCNFCQETYPFPER